MMRPLIACTLILSLALAGLMGAALVIGRQAAPPTWAALLKLGACELPCWIGIEPGKTTVGAAKEQIAAAYGDTAIYQLQENNNYFTVIYKATGQRVGVVLDAGIGQTSDQAVVDKIHLWPDLTLNSAATIAELYGRLGHFEALRLSNIGGSPVLILLDGAQRVGVVVDTAGCNAVSPTQGIYIIVLASEPLADYFTGLSALTRWQGFQKCYNLEFPAGS